MLHAAHLRGSEDLGSPIDFDVYRFLLEPVPSPVGDIDEGLNLPPRGKGHRVLDTSVAVPSCAVGPDAVHAGALAHAAGELQEPYFGFRQHLPPKRPTGVVAQGDEQECLDHGREHEATLSHAQTCWYNGARCVGLAGPTPRRSAASW